MNSKGCTPQWREKIFEAAMRRNHVPLSIFPIRWLKSTDYFSAPASTKYHAAYPGGLFDHNMNVLDELLRLTRNHTTCPWGRPESPFIIATLHDVTKLGLYLEQKDNDEITYVKNPDYVWNGHGEDSVNKLLMHMELTEEEKMCIRYHMGAYETEDWDGYDKAIRMYPNVLWTHAADMIASKVAER